MKSTNQVGAVLLPMFLILMTSLVVELHIKLDFRFCLVLVHLVSTGTVSSCTHTLWYAALDVTYISFNIQECKSRNVSS